jgi:arsenate reductase
MTDGPLFICYGNICRSQMAEGWYRHLTGGRPAASAGVDTSYSSIFGGPTPETIQVMAEVGVRISGDVTQLEPAQLERAEIVIILCRPTDCPEFVWAHPDVRVYPVEDPFGKPLPVFRRVRDEIKLIVQEII